MRRKILSFLSMAGFALLLAGSCFILGRGAFELADTAAVSQTGDPGPAEESPVPSAPIPLAVIDPGHGGEDGGASVAGIVEKDVNLAVSERLGDLCTFFGLPALLTRTEDEMLYDRYGDLSDYAGKQKTYDLRNRLRMAEESGLAVLLS